MSTATLTAGNARLRAALVASGLTVDALAEAIRMDPRTVERWMNEPGRMPHARHAMAAAKLLHADPYELWPTLGSRRRAQAEPQEEVLSWYPNRSAVPAALWSQLLDKAADRIDITVSCGLFLGDVVPDLVAVLARRARAGVRVRLALPDPTGAATQHEATRLLLIEDLFAVLQDVPGVRLFRHHGVANDVIRADDDLLVSPKVDGAPAAACPVLHLHRLERAPFTGTFLLGLDHVFATALPRDHRWTLTPGHTRP
ncbi:helix-turn-helix domain-containing protein [Kitasatospora phosalacinea]|uniref:Transcriptional regulator n=1 Tax=Kitasatospora phosalacinea TaxID=2065 RepID=A0A9W6PFB1_9ACTN|nr:helix-turn-helix transcriptional regulator [Kitasatospora phosalacinea]GLW53868.1 transcriptional regulator [Kitasatospora phosalacinea]